MSSLSIWYSKQSKEREKGKYESRKSQVSSVKNKVYDASDDYVNNINSKIDDLAGALGKAIMGISDVTTLKNNVLWKKEKIGTSDGHLSSFDSNLASEISDCNTKISALEGEISSLNRSYNVAVEAEREAAKKAAKKIFKV